MSNSPSPNSFLTIIDQTPLVSVDLVIKNPQGEVLLGLRRNRPARDSWFVPGGRIKKNERIAAAIQRISLAEVGSDLSGRNPKLLGAFEHLYEDNYFNAPGITTHYVVLAFLITLADNLTAAPDPQHLTLQWWSVAALRQSPLVHHYTKAYFAAEAGEDC
ncbi:GDP-mannose mannosyl hydrolase [Thiovibrio sp. JS02]